MVRTRKHTKGNDITITADVVKKEIMTSQQEEDYEAWILEREFELLRRRESPYADE